MIIYSVFYFFGIVVKDAFHGSNKITVLYLSILIAVQLFGIQYFLTKMRASFGMLEISPEKTDQLIRPIDQLKDHFTASRFFYLFITFAFFPFLMIKINAYYAPIPIKIFFYQGNPTFWSLMLDIYANFVSFFMLYLFAVILWMIFNISWLLSKMNNKLYYESLKIKPLDSDNLGGLKSIRDLLLQFSIYYSLIIILAVFNYKTSRGLYLYESISLSIFWLIGIAFFLIGWIALRQLLKGKIENEVSSLSEILEYKRLQLIDLITKNKEKESEDQMNSLSNALDIINKERDRILQYKIKPFDAKTIILFLSSSSISLITIFKTLEDLTKYKIVMFAVNSTQPYFNDMLNYSYHFFPK